MYKIFPKVLKYLFAKKKKQLAWDALFSEIISYSLQTEVSFFFPSFFDVVMVVRLLKLIRHKILS